MPAAVNRVNIGGMGCTVLVVDDHAEFRAVARALLEAGGFTVVGESADGESALTDAIRMRPDLVLLDVQLPGIDGFAVAERLTSVDRTGPAVVLISSRSAISYRRRIAASRAVGFISKKDLSGEAVSALLDAAAGDARE